MIRDLVPSLSLDNLLAQRDAMVERLRKAAELVSEVETLSQAAFDNDDAVPRLECRRSHVSFPDGVAELVKRVDAAAWDFLMNKSGLRTFMDAQARAQWQKDIYERRVPELTAETIEATFSELFAARREMFERGVVEAFRKLSWDYKTNNPVMFGKRIILRYVVDTWGSGRGRYVSGPSQSGCDRLDDLIRVLAVLDGKPEPDHRQGAYYQLHERIGIGRELPAEALELAGLLTVRCFRNGNGHVTFLRPELVEKLNAIVASHFPGALPPAREVTP